MQIHGFVLIKKQFIKPNPPALNTQNQTWSNPLRDKIIQSIEKYEHDKDFNESLSFLKKYPSKKPVPKKSYMSQT